MTKISTPLFFITSILSFFGGLMYSRLNRITKEIDKPKHKNETFVIQKEGRVSEIHTHTTYYGDTMYVENDTTFIRRK